MMSRTEIKMFCTECVIIPHHHLDGKKPLWYNVGSNFYIIPATCSEATKETEEEYKKELDLFIQKWFGNIPFQKIP